MAQCQFPPAAGATPVCGGGLGIKGQRFGIWQGTSAHAITQTPLVRRHPKRLPCHLFAHCSTPSLQDMHTITCLPPHTRVWPSMDFHRCQIDAPRK